MEKRQKDKTDTALNSCTEKRLQERETLSRKKLIRFEITN